MREKVVEKNRPFLGLNGQNEYVTRRGWEVMEIRPRALFAALKTLNSKKSHSHTILRDYARSSGELDTSMSRVLLHIGGSTPRDGVRTVFAHKNAQSVIGVVPCLSAEAEDQKNSPSSSTGSLPLSGLG